MYGNANSPTNKCLLYTIIILSEYHPTRPARSTPIAKLYRYLIYPISARIDGVLPLPRRREPRSLLSHMGHS